MNMTFGCVRTARVACTVRLFALRVHQHTPTQGCPVYNDKAVVRQRVYESAWTMLLRDRLVSRRARLVAGADVVSLGYSATRLRPR